MGIQLVQGRVFDDHDRADSQSVAVISDLTARTFWPNENPIGKRIAMGPKKNGEPVWREIVGVVRSTRHFGLEAPQKPEIYVPHTQVPSPFMVLIVRVRGDMDQAVSACRKEVASLEPQQAGFAVSRVEDMLSDAQSGRRFQTFVLSSFAVLAMFLAAIGIYGVMAYSAQQRMRELGVRIALGATAADVRTMVVWQGLRLALIGIAIGIAAAFGLTRFLTGFLYGVKAWDPTVFVLAPIILCSVGLAAVWLPARRASRIDPIQALRHD